MKKSLKQICAVILAVLTLTPSAFALKVIPIDTDKAFSEEIRNSESVSNWAILEIDAAYAAGLIPALTDKPGYQDTITREQFAELVVQAVTVICGAPDAAPAGTFTDTDNPFILQAYQAGIVNGVGNGKFAPKETTNREQIAVMIARAADYVNQKVGVNLTPAAGDISKYTDKAQVSSWAVDGVGLLAANGIMKGTSTTTLSPKNPCTVEQSILLCYRVYQTTL